MIELDTVIEAPAWREAGIGELVERAAAAAYAAADPPGAGPVGATLLLTDDAAIRELNRRWRGEDKATNVLSFPSAAPAPPGAPRELGDIALAYETVRSEAEREGKSLADHAAHLVVHGILHLLGQDHGTDEDAARMERVETDVLARLGIPDPYRDLEA